MSETTINDHQPIPEPAEILATLIIIVLTPMFLTATSGNIAHARVAAAQTLESYRAETHSDLITVALIIAFGLAALGSLGLSMTDGLSIPMILRLRGSAQSCSRAAEQNRRALAQSRQSIPPTETPHYLDDPEPEFDEAEVIAAVAANQKRAAALQAQMNQSGKTNLQPDAVQTPAPQTDIAPPTPSIATDVNPARATAEQRNQAVWANAFMTVAAEIAAEIPGLPPLQRKDATIRAAALKRFRKRAHGRQSRTSPKARRPIPRLRRVGDPQTRIVLTNASARV